MDVPSCKIEAHAAYLGIMREQSEIMCQEAIKEGDEHAYWLWDKFRLDIACAQSRLRDIRAYHVGSNSE